MSCSNQKLKFGRKIESKRRSFTSVAVISEDRKYGLSTDNGSNYNGMLGLLQRDEADYAPVAFTMTADRTRDFDFMDVIFISDTKLYVRNPKMSYNWMAYIKPLTRDSWVTVAVLAVLMALCLSSASLLVSQKNTKDLQKLLWKG